MTDVSECPPILYAQQSCRIGTPNARCSLLKLDLGNVDADQRLVASCPLYENAALAVAGVNQAASDFTVVDVPITTVIIEAVMGHIDILPAGSHQNWAWPLQAKNTGVAAKRP